MTDTDPSTTEIGITRRELLKRGAVLGGALVWAAPVVQTIGMRAAFAQDTSPRDCPNLYCLKAEVHGGSLGNFAPYTAGQGKGKGNCLKPNDDCNPTVDPAILTFLNNLANRGGDLEGTFTVKLPPGCTVADSSGSEDVFGIFSGAVAKCGRKGNQQDEPCFPADETDFPTLAFKCGNDTEISHIELIICCPDPTE